MKLESRSSLHFGNINILETVNGLMGYRVYWNPDEDSQKKVCFKMIFYQGSYIYIYIYMFIEVSADRFYVIRDFSGISAWV